MSESNSPLPSNEGHQPTHAGPQRGKKPHRGAIIGIIVVALAIIIGVLVVKPSGLFGRVVLSRV